MKTQDALLTILRNRKGFSLVELLIVVIILAALAAVIVPQFSSSTDDAKLSALDTSLANMRGIIDLYYQQHNGVYPGANTSATGGTGTCTGTVGTGKLETSQAFMDQLTRYTNAVGQSCTVKDTNFKYGPYLKKDTLPNNPFTENEALANLLVISTTGALGMTSEATPTGGWRFDVKTGQFIANHADYDDR